RFPCSEQSRQPGNISSGGVAYFADGDLRGERSIRYLRRPLYHALVELLVFRNDSGGAKMGLGFPAGQLSHLSQTFLIGKNFDCVARHCFHISGLRKESSAAMLDDLGHPARSE